MFENIPIEDLKGLSKSYEPIFYYSYPFVEKFNHKNCICVAVTRSLNPHTDLNLFSFQIEFLKEVNNLTYKDKLNTKGFTAMGLALLESTDEENALIIKDLKNNSEFYFDNWTKIL
jgi:hypothetical protein